MEQPNKYCDDLRLKSIYQLTLAILPNPDSTKIINNTHEPNIGKNDGSGGSRDAIWCDCL